MSDGNVIEHGPIFCSSLTLRFDTPLNLYDREDGPFRLLCEKASISRQDICLAQATDAES